MPFDETLPLSTDSGQQTASINLSARHQLTYEELLRLDPQLAGLFKFGHELVTRLNEPGAVYLLGHVCREVCNGITRTLTEGGLQTSGNTKGHIPDKEDNRVHVGRLLQLDPNHALVTTWFHLQRTFPRAAHWDGPPSPSIHEVRSSFFQLCDLLYGRIAPYFDAHSELDRFLTIASPTSKDLESLRMLLVRPQLRRHFFMRLQHANWLVFLNEAGYFKNPPERKIWPDGKWSFQGWPEGQYLARVAASEPERITEILLSTPKKLQNPAVWAIVVDAAKAMPGIYSSQLIPLIKYALKNAPSELFPHLAIDLVKVLAEQGEQSAFDLAKALLALNSEPKEGEEEQQTGTNFRWLRGRHETEWMLKRIEVYDLKKFCGNVLPALEALDPFHTVKFFAGQLDRSVRLGQPVVDLNAWFEHDHRRWCPYLDRDGQDDDVRVIFAIAFTALAKRVSRRDPASAKAVFEVIRQYTNSLFLRISYAVLESAGISLQQELDKVVASGELIDPQCGAREAAALLRAQFGNASPDAKRLFCYAIERGPSAEEVKELVLMRRSHESPESEQASDADDAISEAEIAEAVGNWQRRRLTRFHDQLPPELQPLAERLGVNPQVPSPEDQALDEVGYYIGGGWSYGGDQSPKTPEELVLMGVEDALRFLATWQPGSGSSDGPSSFGLGSTLAALANEHEDFAISILEKGAQESLTPGYMKALLDGFFRAAEAKKIIPWERLLPIVVAVVQISAKSRTVTESQQDAALQDEYNLEERWRDAVRATANLVREGCAKNLIPTTLADDVWKYAELAVHSPLMWMGEWTPPQKNSIEDALMAALNTVGGDVVRMLIDVALWDYRQGEERGNSDIEQTPLSTKMVERLTTLLSHVLFYHKNAALGAHAMLGHLIPQIDFLVPEWISRMEDQLFESGAEDPRYRPIWGAYVTGAGIYNSTFSKLRKWYLRAAEVAECSGEVKDQNTRDSDWSLTKALAIHIIVGIIRGLCNVGDEDALVEKTFSNVPVEDRSHAYWEVFRAWSDSKDAIPVEYAQRIVSFWEWRLTELESTSEASERENEADGLMWFLKTPYIPAADSIRLGLRTLQLNSGKKRERITTWERLDELAKIDAAGTFDLVEHIIEQEFLADYAFFPYENVAPPLKAAYECSDSSVRVRAKRLINKLGERGYLEFGNLLSSDRASDA